MQSYFFSAADSFVAREALGKQRKKEVSLSFHFSWKKQGNKIYYLI